MTMSRSVSVRTLVRTDSDSEGISTPKRAEKRYERWIMPKRNSTSAVRPSTSESSAQDLEEFVPREIAEALVAMGRRTNRTSLARLDSPLVIVLITRRRADDELTPLDCQRALFGVSCQLLNGFRIELGDMRRNSGAHDTPAMLLVNEEEMLSDDLTFRQGEDADDAPPPYARRKHDGAVLQLVEIVRGHVEGGKWSWRVTTACPAFATLLEAPESVQMNASRVARQHGRRDHHPSDRVLAGQQAIATPVRECDDRGRRAGAEILVWAETRQRMEPCVACPSA